mmetsp:Transcript_18064/g.15995  ORF Transcript_18064/g.15995 Transcript_18064/m.15995 type:complete len:104 (+) Transcript_18064:528-839(+)
MRNSFSEKEMRKSVLEKYKNSNSRFGTENVIVVEYDDESDEGNRSFQDQRFNCINATLSEDSVSSSVFFDSDRSLKKRTFDDLHVIEEDSAELSKTGQFKADS